MSEDRQRFVGCPPALLRLGKRSRYSVPHDIWLKVVRVVLAVIAVGIRFLRARMTVRMGIIIDVISRDSPQIGSGEGVRKMKTKSPRFHGVVSACPFTLSPWGFENVSV